MFAKANYSVTMSAEKNGRGERHLKIMATVRGRSITFPTNIYVGKNQMDGEIIVSHPQASGLNAMINKYIIDLQAVELELFKREIDVTIHSLYALYTDHIASDTPLVDFCDYVLKHSTTRRATTKERYYSIVKRIDKYHPKVCLEDIDVIWLKKYEDHMLATGVSDSTVWVSMKVIRMLFNEAIKRDLMRPNQNPFKFYEIPEIRSRNDVLSFQEIEELELMGFKLAAERHIRDLFCFACYCGLRFSDLMHLKNDNLRKDGNITWLQVKTQKTGAFVQIPLSVVFFGNAMRILEKYKDIEDLCSYENNSSINKGVKAIIDKSNIGGGQRITMHTARRSFITGLIDFGVPIATAQKLAGHARITTTSKYLQLSTGTILRDVEQAFSKAPTKILHVDLKRKVLRVSPTGHRLVIGGELLRCKNCSFYQRYNCKLFHKKRTNDDWCDSFSERLNSEPDYF